MVDAHDARHPQRRRTALNGLKLKYLGITHDYKQHCTGDRRTWRHRTRAEQAREVRRINLESSLWTLQAWITSLLKPNFQEHDDQVDQIDEQPERG